MSYPNSFRHLGSNNEVWLRASIVPSNCRCLCGYGGNTGIQCYALEKKDFLPRNSDASPDSIARSLRVWGRGWVGSVIYTVNELKASVLIFIVIIIRKTCNRVCSDLNCGKDGGGDELSCFVKMTKCQKLRMEILYIYYKCMGMETIIWLVIACLCASNAHSKLCSPGLLSCIGWCFVSYLDKFPCSLRRTIPNN